MNISRQWLADYVKVNCTLEELCRTITMAGIEVEAIESAGGIPDGVVAGRILERKPHPDSDHMSVCRVDVGSGDPIQIVCGAPNCDAGNTVPVATIGTTFHTPEGDFKIKKSKLRGVESFGMMCSEEELGISKDNSGLMILDPATKLGTPLTALFPGDAKIELEVTPNRPDWLSVFGIARDVACLFASEAKMPVITVPAITAPEKFDRLVTIEAPDLCTRYKARVIRNVKVGPSPEWLKNRLESVGLRSINNVVDVTNFVMMELGQPLHAFDLNLLAGKRIVARRAKAGETLTTLDGTALKLAERHLVIADAEKPMALAGVMGGLDSGVTEKTTDILLESAVFFSSNIRATSRELGISTDASYRYERGVDFDMAPAASDRAVQLILETAGGELVAEEEVMGARPAEHVIPCRFGRIRSLLGSSVTNERIVEIFTRLHLQVADVNETGCVVTAPLFRLDLDNEADLAEEVARINGLDQIPQIPVAARCCAPYSEDAYASTQLLRDSLISLGFYECMHYSMVNVNSALADRRFKKEDLLSLKNPLSLELAVLRPGLLGEMLGTMERNISRQNRTFRLFEVGKVFCGNAQLFPEERDEIILALSGQRAPEQYSEERKETYDFYDLKGALEGFFELLRIKRYKFEAVEDARFKQGRAAAVIIDGKHAGDFGELAADLTNGWRTTYPVYAAQLEATVVLGAAGRCAAQFAPFSLYPAVSRDVAFLAPLALEHEAVLNFFRKAKVADLETVQLVDIFSDDKLKADGRKSMAYQLTFRRADRTLTDTEINQRFDSLRERLANDLKVELR